MTSETRPLRAVGSRWCSDPDVASAYSYLRPGGTPADRDRLGAEVYPGDFPGLHLAGEATWAAHPGTMHGAWFSGERAARHVLERGRADRVVIVGAGLAGLAAARVLTDQGDGPRSVVVLEADAKPGGRARADHSLRVPVHLGAAWIHGDRGNPISALAVRAGVPTDVMDWTRRASFVVGHGWLSRTETARLDTARERVDSGIEIAAQLPEDRALGPVVRELVAVHGRDPFDRMVLLSWIRSEYEGIYAAPIDDLSVRYRSEPFYFEGDNATVLGSLDRVVAVAAEGLDVRCGVRVHAIGWADAGNSWVVSSGDGWLPADAVIVTVPIGVLQRGGIHFTPPLPDAVVDAMSRIGSGRVAKVVATFARAFWAPSRSVSLVADPPVLVPGWMDVSRLAGVPALAGFATADAVDAVEAMDEPALIEMTAATLSLAYP